MKYIIIQIENLKESTETPKINKWIYQGHRLQD